MNKDELKEQERILKLNYDQAVHNLSADIDRQIQEHLQDRQWRVSELTERYRHELAKLQQEYYETLYDTSNDHVEIYDIQDFYAIIKAFVKDILSKIHPSKT